MNSATKAASPRELRSTSGFIGRRCAPNGTASTTRDDLPADQQPRAAKASRPPTRTDDWGEGTTIPPEKLPAGSTAYLAAHQSDETAVAITSYAAYAVMIDAGHAHRGLDIWLLNQGFVAALAVVGEQREQGLADRAGRCPASGRAPVVTGR
ncbi:hypothetical protein MCAG_02609 [Micromonospora sp. ATCC 39149]|uniref:Uncharacterized protein n=1 Tax=Micromonospora carbonacea TaxID=47853 RepID=A0A7D5YD21_9ACTN|nr:hypothetical protein [Micromonospora sp. ATCC 39149]EEP72282.1 hypothetical protein MCAG_02609 [Micromonospora sp. ATCC 39149]QLJ98453.1 hypothetical protein HZU44_27910 [Micromonospora carbonacea]